MVTPLYVCGLPQVALKSYAKKNSETKCQNIPEPRATSLNCLFCPRTSPKPEDSSCVITDDEETQENPHILEAGTGKCLATFLEK